MLEGPTLWFVLRRRLGLARQRVLLVALAVLLAGSASVIGVVRHDAAASGMAAPRSGGAGTACGPVRHGAGIALVPDHSRQLPAPSPVAVLGDTAACRQWRSLVPRGEPLPAER